jgi:hypothetical protein
LTPPLLAPQPPVHPQRGAFAEGEAVWLVEDGDVLPARVIRCYTETADPFTAGERILLKVSDPDRPCPVDVFASLVFGEWDTAKRAAG